MLLRLPWTAAAAAAAKTRLSRDKGRRRAAIGDRLLAGVDGACSKSLPPASR